MTQKTVSNEARMWLPWAFDHLQGYKKLVGLMANVLVFLALAQIAGVDIAELTKGRIVPPLAWWGTALLAALALGMEARLSNAQEYERRNGISVNTRHDIRNKVSVILTAVGALKTEDIPLEEAMTVIRASGKAIIRIIEEAKLSEAKASLSELENPSEPPGDDE